ncbi:MAG: helix-turn-helix transcriptional regulator [Bacteroidetes bacterium]|nr:helix-turn-helix transcriptional regulator [Bacteroidota bacterium]
MKNISQGKLASAIGMSREGYSRMLKDKTMKVSVLESIAGILDVPVTYFFEEESITQKKAKDYPTNDSITLANEESAVIKSLTEDVHYHKQTNIALLNLIDKQKAEIKGLVNTIKRLDKSVIGNKLKEV